MKKNSYQLFEEIGDNIFLHFCTSTNSFLLMSKPTHDYYMNSSADEIKREQSDLFQHLVDNGFLINEKTNEQEDICLLRDRMKFDREEYHVVINTTLDCNLNCWYCYESKIVGSRLNDKTISNIIKNLESRFTTYPFRHLRISFFGGEPFMDFTGIKKILDFAKGFTSDMGILLTADFTTNATLINDEIIEYLKSFHCSFQITLDGNRERHNKIKACAQNPFDTYQATINSLRLINKEINNRHVAVRINFDNHTLKKIDEILEDIDFLDRRSTTLILKRIWQIKSVDVIHDLLLENIQKILDKGFLLDYYVMPKGCLCFADRESQVLFNFDGGIFKCTTISNFDKNNALGTLDSQTGEIIWDRDKIQRWMDNMQPSRCISCEWFPVCLGICNRQLIAHPQNPPCNMDGLSLTRKEYLMYLFKYNLQKERIRVASQT